MMLETILQELPNALLWGVLGALIFGLLGLVSGTDETATITPITLLVVLLGVSPVGIFSFFIAAVVAKHMTHAVPTTLLGIPGDTMAIPLMREADLLRRLGVPHIALRKAISAAFISAMIAIPVAVIVAAVLAPVADIIEEVAPWAFVLITIVIAYLTPARLGGVMAMIPFVVLILGLREFTAAHDTSLTISYFLGIAVGPLIVSLLGVLTPHGREEAHKDTRTYHLSTRR
ncbi:tripartite tricarboxylate transporter permease [Corynebacterium variabile]